MAAYAAVVSLKNTIERILESSRFSLIPPSPKILLRLCRPLKLLKRVLKRLDRRSKSKSRKKVNVLDEEIKEALWRFEDLLEHHLSLQILSQSGDASSLFSIDLQILQSDVDSFIETIKDLKRKYVYELDNMPLVEDDEWVLSRNDFDGVILPLYSDLYAEAKLLLTYDGFFNEVFYLCGMAGSGKTTLVKRLFDDREVSRWFHHRVWVTVGRKPQLGEIERRILAEVDPNINSKCLVVLDDVWDKKAMDSLTSSLFNDHTTMFRILLATKISENNYRKNSGFVLDRPWSMRPLSAEESEDLLREKVFGEGGFPPHLKEAAKKIAKNCRGLPLMIVTVAGILSSANNTDAQYWDDLAEKRNSVLRDASNEIAKVLFPVYDCFPQYLKMFFLYVGAFPEDSEIPTSKLTHLLDGEGFLEVQTLRLILRFDLKNFGSESDIVSIKLEELDGFTFKTFSINAFWRLLFNIVASRDKFCRVLDSSFESSEEGVKGQRRLCLHSNFLFNFKNVYDSVKRDCVFNARSLLCFGPYHQYSMPLDVGFKLLRVLDALKVHFYIFPIEILSLVQLQYLALSYNGKIPTSISQLVNLQFLIILPHVSVKSCGAPSYVPVQIWDMQELKHVDISGSNLPNPNSHATLQKLSTLLGVSPSSCTREVLERIPNIRKLGIQIELTPQDESCDHLNCIFLPDNLYTFKCSILNPEVKHGFVAPMTPLSLVPQGLRKLHLSGLGYPWKYMKTIGSLPNLEVLKLRCYAFRGPKWETKGKSFVRLKFLLIEDSDLVHWIPFLGSFPNLEHLSLKHCYRLQEFHWPNDDCMGGRIELVNCSPLAITCAKQLSQKIKNGFLEVTASSDDEELQRIYYKRWRSSNSD